MRLAPRPNLTFDGTRDREESELVRADTVSEPFLAGGREAGYDAATSRVVDFTSAMLVSFSTS